VLEQMTPNNYVADFDSAEWCESLRDGFTSLLRPERVQVSDAARLPATTAAAEDPAFAARKTRRPPYARDASRRWPTRFASCSARTTRMGSPR